MAGLGSAGAGLETTSCSLAGEGTDGSVGGWNEVLGHQQVVKGVPGARERTLRLVDASKYYTDGQRNEGTRDFSFVFLNWTGFTTMHLSLLQ